MAFFATEKETERWLEHETRNIPCPDGSKLSVTSFKLTWRSFDYILEESDITEEQIVEVAALQAEGTNKPYSEAFLDAIVNIHIALRKARGIDE